MPPPAFYALLFVIMDVSAGIIIFFILGGILSPSDIFSQIIISFFIFFIYEIVIFFSLLVQNYIKCV